MDASSSTPPSSTPPPSTRSRASLPVVGKAHPYQNGGPIGAYEIKQVEVTTANGSLQRGTYVRVDIPGVPSPTVNVQRIKHNNTVKFDTFTQVRWGLFEEIRRFGCVINLTKDPTKVKFSQELKNGLMKFFFPSDCQVKEITPIRPFEGDDANVEPVEGVAMSGVGDTVTTLIEHGLPEVSGGIHLKGGNCAHINPFLLSGPKGIYEGKIVYVPNWNKHLVYVRLDVPGISHGDLCITENSDRSISIGCEGHGEEFDDMGRKYFCSLVVVCECCRYTLRALELKDGVLRFLAEKLQDQIHSPPSIVHSLDSPPTPGGDPVWKSVCAKLKLP